MQSIESGDDDGVEFKGKREKNTKEFNISLIIDVEVNERRLQLQERKIVAGREQ